MDSKKIYSKADPKGIQIKWIKAFELKNINNDSIHKLSEGIETLFDGGIYLKTGSLYKLMIKDKIEHIKKIKDTLEKPEALILQNDGAFIFVKKFGNGDQNVVNKANEGGLQKKISF